MPRIALHTQAPDFTLDDFQGKAVQLTHYAGKANLLLVFNRGFA